MHAPTFRRFQSSLVLVSLSVAGIAFASPSPTDFSLNSRSDGESKISTLTTQNRSLIKLDFIPVDERASRSSRGFPTVTTPQGVYGIEGHGSPHSVFCRSGVPMNAKELAQWIRKDSRYQAGMTVYLMCCETGKGDRAIAQKLADTLGTEVVAPTEKLWPLKNGLYIVAQERMRKSFGMFETGEQRADITRLGSMKTFKPSTTSTVLAASSRESTETASSSNAASTDRPEQPPKKPLLRASARTAALLAGFQGQRDSGTLYLNSKHR